MIELVPAAEEHIGPIAEAPRPADVEEVRASTGGSVRAALERGLRSSTRAYTVMLDGVPVAMLGVVPYSALTGVGIVWMLGAEGLDRGICRRGFVRLARPVIDHLQAFYPRMLFNAVDCRNGAAIRFLRWAGFTLQEPIPLGLQGQSFFPFYREG